MCNPQHGVHTLHPAVHAQDLTTLTSLHTGGLLAFEFVMMHWVENLRFADIKNHGSVNEVGAWGC